MMRLAPVLIVGYTLFVTLPLGRMIKSITNDNTPLCCRSQCGTKSIYSSVDIIEIINESPNYLHVTPPNVYSNTVDNECFTYFNINDTSYMLFIGIRYLNGSGEFRKYTTFALAGYSGVSRIQNLAEDSGSCSFVFDEVYLGDACPGVRVYYRNYVEGPCDFFNNVNQDNVDFVHGDSSNRDISDFCKSQVAAVANSQQLRGTQLVALPNRLNRCCVTQFNGASCVNADRVLPQDSVSVNL